VLSFAGEAAVLDDAFNILIEEIYPQVLEQEDIKPYGPGSLENVVSMDPPVFEFKVPLAPEVTLGDYRSVRVDFENKEVQEEDVQSVLDNLLEQQATIEESDKPAKEGDMVYVILSGDRKVPDEEKGMLIEERRFPVLIEKEDADESNEWPFPGFSRNLLAANVGDEKTLEYSFPEDYQFKDLQNVEAVYQIKVDEIKGRILPELNDEFAKLVGEFETVEDLTNTIKENIQQRYDEEDRVEFETKIIEEILKDSEIKYPPLMLEHELEHYLNDLKNRLQNQGMNMDLYLKSRDQDLEALKEEVTPNAIESMKRGLILMEVASQEKIELTPEDVEAKVQEQVQQIKEYFPEKESKKMLSGESLQNLVARIVSNEVNTMTLERIRKIALGENLEVEAEVVEESTEETAAEVEEVETELVEETAEETADEQIEEEKTESDSNEILMENEEDSVDNKEDE
jgi:trigger factor